jgi:hypothetical protein
LTSTLLGRELGDRVAVSSTPGGTAITGAIHSVQHRYDRKRHIGRFNVTNTLATMFTLDVSQLDSTTHLLGY